MWADPETDLSRSATCSLTAQYNTVSPRSSEVILLGAALKR